MRCAPYDSRSTRSVADRLVCKFGVAPAGLQALQIGTVSIVNENGGESQYSAGESSVRLVPPVRAEHRDDNGHSQVITAERPGSFAFRFGALLQGALLCICFCRQLRLKLMQVLAHFSSACSIGPSK